MAKDNETKQQQEQGMLAATPEKATSRPCPQNCALCTMPQQIFCTTKMLFDLSRAHQELKEKVDAISESIKENNTTPTMVPDPLA